MKNALSKGMALFLSVVIVFLQLSIVSLAASDNTLALLSLFSPCLALSCESEKNDLSLQAEVWDYPEQPANVTGMSVTGDIPEELAKAAFSEKLASLAIHYPLIWRIFAMSSTCDAMVETLKNQSTAFRELMGREDGYTALVDFFCDTEIDYSVYRGLSYVQRQEMGMDLAVKSGALGFQFIGNWFWGQPPEQLSQEDYTRFEKKYRERYYMLFPPETLSDPRFDPLRVSGDPRFTVSHG